MAYNFHFIIDNSQSAANEREEAQDVLNYDDSMVLNVSNSHLLCSFLNFFVCILVLFNIFSSKEIAVFWKWFLLCLDNMTLFDLIFFMLFILFIDYML